MLMIDKAVRLGAEFGIKPILVASGQEWRRPDLIKATGAQFIVPSFYPRLQRCPAIAIGRTSRLASFVHGTGRRKSRQCSRKTDNLSHSLCMG